MDNAAFQMRIIKIEREYQTALERVTAERMQALNTLYAEIGADETPQDEPADIPFDRPPRSSAETLEGKILAALQKLGYSEEALNRWCGRQFPDFQPDKHDWSEMAHERKLMVLATFEAKVTEKAAAK